MGKYQLRHFAVLVRVPGSLFPLVRRLATSPPQVWSSQSQLFQWDSMVLLQKILSVSLAVIWFFLIAFNDTLVCLFPFSNTVVCVHVYEYACVCLVNLVFLKLKIYKQVSSAILPRKVPISFFVISSSVTSSRLPQAIPLLQLDQMSLFCDFLML